MQIEGKDEIDPQIYEEVKALIDEAVNAMKEENKEFESALEKLLSDRKISGELASSLMNDNNIVRGILKNLVKTTKILYLKSDFLTTINDSTDKSAA